MDLFENLTPPLRIQTLWKVSDRISPLQVPLGSQAQQLLDAWPQAGCSAAWAAGREDTVGSVAGWEYWHSFSPKCQGWKQNRGGPKVPGEAEQQLSWPVGVGLVLPIQRVWVAEFLWYQSNTVKRGSSGLVWSGRRGPGFGDPSSTGTEPATESCVWAIYGVLPNLWG